MNSIENCYFNEYLTKQTELMPNGRMCQMIFSWTKCHEDTQKTLNTFDGWFLRYGRGDKH